MVSYCCKALFISSTISICHCWPFVWFSLFKLVVFSFEIYPSIYRARYFNLIGANYPRTFHRTSICLYTCTGVHSFEEESLESPAGGRDFNAVSLGLFKNFFDPSLPNRSKLVFQQGRSSSSEMENYDATRLFLARRSLWTSLPRNLHESIGNYYWRPSTGFSSRSFLFSFFSLFLESLLESSEKKNTRKLFQKYLENL